MRLERLAEAVSPVPTVAAVVGHDDSQECG